MSSMVNLMVKIPGRQATIAVATQDSSKQFSSKILNNYSTNEYYEAYVQRGLVTGIFSKARPEGFHQVFIEVSAGTNEGTFLYIEYDFITKSEADDFILRFLQT